MNSFRAYAALFALATAFVGDAIAAPPVLKPATPASILESAPPAAWKALAADDLLVMDLHGGKRVVLLLAPAFAPAHVGNIKALARAHFYDGLWIDRVQDNYVVQWGDPDEQRKLPTGLALPTPAEYEQPAKGIAFRPIPYRDVFAPAVGFVAGWPVAQDAGQAWLTHCYGMVGVGRNNAPDTGSGAELYAVMGQSPRALDRNITLVGRVVVGMEHMTALPRGTGDLGFYKTKAEMLPIVRVRLASDLPPAERPSLAMLDSDSATFAAWVKARANRADAFFIRPAGAVDLCNVLPPIKSMR
jgi:peptidylprolyl isomerase